MINLLLTIGALAGLGGLATTLTARRRVPRPFRSVKTSIAVSMSCVAGRHGRCGDHLACPCNCHDAAIHRALTSTRHSGRAAAPFVERD